MQETISIPLRASYCIINGEVVKHSSEHADISGDAIAKLLILGFGGLPTPVDEANQMLDSRSDDVQAFQG